MTKYLPVFHYVHTGPRAGTHDVVRLEIYDYEQEWHDQWDFDDVKYYLLEHYGDYWFSKDHGYEIKDLQLWLLFQLIIGGERVRGDVEMRDHWEVLSFLSWAEGRPGIFGVELVAGEPVPTGGFNTLSVGDP